MTYKVAVNFNYNHSGTAKTTTKIFETNADFSTKTPDDFQDFATALLATYGTTTELKKITVSKVEVKNF